MGQVGKQLDTNLSRLAWSLWTELGVAGLERKHRAFSVAPEELIILTSVLSEFDPRLRDEALDWCILNHHLISPIRLQILTKKYNDYVAESFSIFSTTFNNFASARTKWVVLAKVSPLKFRPSNKSILRSLEAPSMVYFRLRSFLGVGACSDVLGFLLNEKFREFTASDLLETGYSKRRIAQILEDFAAAGIFSKSHIRNQHRYEFVRKNQFIKLLGDVPKKMIHWDRFLEILLPIRACIQNIEEAPIGVRVIDIRNMLNKFSEQLSEIKHVPPPMQNDFEAYWNSVTEWILNLSAYPETYFIVK